jgi:hypothetical protein
MAVEEYKKMHVFKEDINAFLKDNNLHKLCSQRNVGNYILFSKATDQVACL